MFSKLAVITSLALLAVASPTTQASSGQCNTGKLQCCQSVQSSSTPGVSSLLGLLGVVLGGVNVPVGLTCSPISVRPIQHDEAGALTVIYSPLHFRSLVSPATIAPHSPSAARTITLVSHSPSTLVYFIH